MYLTDGQYLNLMIRIRKDLDTMTKIYAEDSTTIGCKHTITNIGLCAGEEVEGGWSKAKYVTRETAMWPKDFDKIGKVEWPYPQQFVMKYRGRGHKCPLDTRGGKTSDGCFYKCLAFKDKTLTLDRVKKLYDIKIDKELKRGITRTIR